MSKYTPLSAAELIERLAAEYPPRCIQVGETLESHIRYAGKAELVGTLKSYLELDRAQS